MISIIVCSNRPNLLSQLQQNIQETIGLTQYEIVAHDNSSIKYGLCKVYNLCASKAKYGNLLFIHEDIVFHTEGWGQKLIEHLTDKKIGVIGIAGSKYKSKLPGPWWGVPKEMQHIHIFQHTDTGRKEYSSINSELNRQPIAIVDGVFMACRKSIWETNPFDEKTFSGFHNYDLDFSLSVGQRSKNLFVNDILIEHFSPGHYNQEWLASSILLIKKWKLILPQSSEKYTDFQMKWLELKSFEHFVALAVSLHSKLQPLLKYLLSYLFNGGRITFLVTQLKISWKTRKKYQ